MKKWGEKIPGQSGQDKQTPGDDKACVLWVQRLEVKSDRDEAEGEAGGHALPFGHY